MTVDEDQRAIARAGAEPVNRRRVVAGAVEALETSRAAAALSYGTLAGIAESGDCGNRCAGPAESSAHRSLRSVRGPP